MFIETLELVNYRNYLKQKVTFKKGVNVLIGQNAQGKTNLIEAIYFCAIGKSPRTKKENDLINFNENHTEIKVDVVKTTGSKKIEAYLNKGSKKSIKINQINLTKIADLIGVLPVVFFSPEDLKLVKETPEDRRKFLDISLSQLSKKYFYLLLRYQKILDQRNKLLKSTPNIDVIKETLPVWDSQLADIGAQIITRRNKLINKLKIYANQSINKLTNNKECLNLSYTGLVGEENEIRQNLYNLIHNSLDKDIKLGYTTIGPHRDDIKIDVNGIDVRTFGSQGQQRTVALALKLSELEIFYEENGEYPILLLDDVMSELDSVRQENLIKACQDVQTIITTTELSDKLSKNTNIIKIKDGRVFN